MLKKIAKGKPIPPHTEVWVVLQPRVPTVYRMKALGKFPNRILRKEIQ